MSRLCVEKDELGLQTKATERLCCSLSQQHSYASPVVQLLFLVPALLISFHHCSSFPTHISSSPPSFSDAEGACSDDLWAR